jgi:putative transcriptional regulator
MTKPTLSDAMKPLADAIAAEADSLSGVNLSMPSKRQDQLNLTNHFLVAMPTLSDPVFSGSVIYLCEHNEKGALGVVINRATDLDYSNLFDRINIQLEVIPDSHPMRDRPVLFGGPVQSDRGFVLHAPLGQFSSSLKVTDDIGFTSSRDILEALASGDAPERLILSIGYAGWGAGQLEQELRDNSWLTVPADLEILFDLPLEEKFDASLKLLGIEAWMLSSEVGHA